MLHVADVLMHLVNYTHIYTVHNANDIGRNFIKSTELSPDFPIMCRCIQKCV